MADIVESRDAIETAISGIDSAAYLSNRLVRSAVERGVADRLMPVSLSASTDPQSREQAAGSPTGG